MAVAGAAFADFVAVAAAAAVGCVPVVSGPKLAVAREVRKNPWIALGSSDLNVTVRPHDLGLVVLLLLAANVAVLALGWHAASIVRHPSHGVSQARGFTPRVRPYPSRQE